MLHPVLKNLAKDDLRFASYKATQDINTLASFRENMHASGVFFALGTTAV